MRTNTQKHNCTNAQIRKCTIHKYKYRKPFEDRLGWDRIAKVSIRAGLLQGTSAQVPLLSREIFQKERWKQYV